jgi:hypothetical protein
VSDLKKILTVILIATNCQTWGEIISTNMSNGNLIKGNYSATFSGVTNNLYLPAGKQLNILSVNTYPQSTNSFRTNSACPIRIFRIGDGMTLSIWNTLRRKLFRNT